MSAKDTLVIVLAETRAAELTFENFRENVYDALNADLCVCIGVSDTYDYDNPYYKLAKYHFTYKEEMDYGPAFDEAFAELSVGRDPYELMISQTLPVETARRQPTKYARVDVIEDARCFNSITDIIKLASTGLADGASGAYDAILLDDIHEANGKLYTRAVGIQHTRTVGIQHTPPAVGMIKVERLSDYVYKRNAITLKKPLHWREYLKLKDQFMGGIRDPRFQHKGSDGILLFFRWFLLKKLKETGLINQYKRFVITRSDYIHRIPHAPMDLLDPAYIWIPNEEDYGGFTDRHAVLSRKNIETYLNIVDQMIRHSNHMILKMSTFQYWNIERLIRFHLYMSNVIQSVRRFPYTMYTVRSANGSTSWSSGKLYPEHGYYVKYDTEYNTSLRYFKKYVQYGDIRSFYCEHIKN